MEEYYSESYQEYLEVILRLTIEKGDDNAIITNADIVDNFPRPIRAPSVTEMIEKLQKNELVEWIKWKGVKLTRKGLLLAKKILYIHHLLEDFFTKVLDLTEAGDEELKHRVACSLEHHLVDEPRLIVAIEKSIRKVS
mgnify:CR=1 FL=1